MNPKTKQYNGVNTIYTAEIVQQLKTEAEIFINEIRMEESEKVQQEESNKMRLKDFIHESAWKRVYEASEEESGFIYVISSLNKIFGIVKKERYAQTVFESMLSLGMLDLRHSLNWIRRSKADSTDHTNPFDVGKWYLEVLCNVTVGTDENERKRTDVMMKKILHEIANKTEKSTRKT